MPTPKPIKYRRTTILNYEPFLEFSSGEVLLFSNPLLQIDGVEKEMDIWKQMNILHKTNEKSCLYDDYYIRHQAKINSLYEERDKIKRK